MRKMSTAAVVGNWVFAIASVVLAILKLQGVIGWSWIWVFCPFWIPLFFGAMFLLFFYTLKKIAKNEAPKGEDTPTR